MDEDLLRFDFTNPSAVDAETLDAIDQVTGVPTKHERLPLGARATRLATPGRNRADSQAAMPL